jgi:hypothetical protein
MEVNECNPRPFYSSEDWEGDGRTPQQPINCATGGVALMAKRFCAQLQADALGPCPEVSPRIAVNRATAEWHRSRFRGQMSLLSSDVSCFEF